MDDGPDNREPVRSFARAMAAVVIPFVIICETWVEGGIAAVPFAVALLAAGTLILIRVGVIQPPRWMGWWDRE